MNCKDQIRGNLWINKINENSVMSFMHGIIHDPKHNQ